MLVDVEFETQDGRLLTLSNIKGNIKGQTFYQIFAVGAGTKLDRDGSKLDSETEQNWIFEHLFSNDWFLAH